MVVELMSRPPKPDLLEGWRIVSFGQVARSVDVQERNPLENGIERYVGLDHLEPGNLHIRSWGDVADGTTFTRRFKPGQVLFGKRRAYQRKAAVAEFDGVCSGDILVFEPLGDDLLPELLPFIVESDGFFAHALRTSAGSLSPRTKWKELAEYEFPLPPKDGQRRIADILWAADAAVERWREARLALDATRERVEGRLFADADEGDRYVTCPLAEVVEYASDGPFGSKLKTEHYSHEGARVIRLQNLGDSEFLDDDKAFVPFAYFANDLARYQVRPGDVLVAGLGDETNPVGRACRAPTDLGPAVNKADCFCIRGKPGLIHNAYLCLALNSAPVRRQVLQKAQGTTRLRVNVSNLKTVRFQVPLLDRQEEVLTLLEPFDHAAEQVSASTITLASMATHAREALLSGRTHV